MLIRAMDNVKTQSFGEKNPQSSYESGSVTFPGELSFRAFDLQTGFASPFSLFRLSIHGRMIALLGQPNSLIDFTKLSKSNFVFVASGNFIVPSSFYNTASPKHPATVQSNLVTFKRSSLVLETSLRMSNITEKSTLATSLVVVSRESRKPSGLPDWWREKYRKFASNESVQFLRAFERPVQIYCRGMEFKPYTVIVPRRDMDDYNHVNVASYIQYCMDALEHHLLTNQIACDINTVSLLIKHARYLHRGESEVGDMLTVALWDDDTEPDAVAFDISKEGKSIYQAKIEFYDKSVLGPPQSRL